MRVHRPNHATVVAYLALFAALGGSAYAVSRVDTNDLKRGAVTSEKIKNDTIGARDVKKLRLREQERTVSRIGDSTTSVVECKKNEKLVGGGGGWIGDGTVFRVLAGSDRLKGGQPLGYGVSGASLMASPNTLVAQAICLPR